MITDKELSEEEAVQLQAEYDSLRGDADKGTYSRFDMSDHRALATVAVRRIYQAVEDVHKTVESNFWLPVGFNAGRPDAVAINLHYLDGSKFAKLDDLVVELEDLLRMEPRYETSDRILRLLASIKDEL